MSSSPSSPTSPPMRARAPKLAQRLVDEVSQRIRGGQLAPGSRIPGEHDMMREHGVSRAVVREAISLLQAAGLVEARQGLGTFVLEPSRSRNFQVDPATVITVRDVLDLLEFRISFESEAAALAALRHTPEQLRVIKDAVEYIQRLLESGVETKKADFDFHLAVAKATGNRYFPELLEHLGLAILPRARLDLRYISSDNAKEYLCRSNGEHREILAAITARDAEGARAAMRVHLTNSRDRLEGLYAKSDAKAPVQG